MTIPAPAPKPNAHRFVRFIHERIEAEDLSRNDVESRAGLGTGTMKHWWDASGAIGLQNMEAALGALGYGLTISLLPAPMEGTPGYEAGKCYRTYSDALVMIRRADERFLFGDAVVGHIPMTWNLAGQRVPRGGEDPFDLRPLQKQERAA